MATELELGLDTFGDVTNSAAMDQTFAEIEPAKKHAMSHRAKAFEKLLHSGIFTESF